MSRDKYKRNTSWTSTIILWLWSGRNCLFWILLSCWIIELYQVSFDTREGGVWNWIFQRRHIGLIRADTINKTALEIYDIIWKIIVDKNQKHGWNHKTSNLRLTRGRLRMRRRWPSPNGWDLFLYIYSFFLYLFSIFLIYIYFLIFLKIFIQGWDPASRELPST